MSTKKKSNKKNVSSDKCCCCNKEFLPKEVVEELLIRAGIVKQYMDKATKVISNEASKVVSTGVMNAKQFEIVLLKGLKAAHEEVSVTAKKIAKTVLAKEKVKKK